jgi:hypothetical protein
VLAEPSLNIESNSDPDRITMSGCLPPALMLAVGLLTAWCIFGGDAALARHNSGTNEATCARPV